MKSKKSKNQIVTDCHCDESTINNYTFSLSFCKRLYQKSQENKNFIEEKKIYLDCQENCHFKAMTKLKFKN